ncbi:LOW QUALITY PROTEIN: hypothetical protein RJ639_041074 [Escallonia herrerae]|uniref:Uncharacterized protein n=1 Tax=Escallonia herrerae TaxID=1293975 RepID=A0AA88WHW9_9ASTE|nr:LOW QUALITY PROTEIN: hypothetical protein RJ639_041074 [Escallonia herrerae]
MANRALFDSCHILPSAKTSRIPPCRKGFHFTFVHSEFKYSNRILARGSDYLVAIDDFRSETEIAWLATFQRTRYLFFLPCVGCGMPVLSSLRNSQTFTPSVHTDFKYFNRLLKSRGSDYLVGIDDYRSETETVSDGCSISLSQRFYRLVDKSGLSNGYLDTRTDWIPAMRGIYPVDGCPHIHPNHGSQ